MVNLLDATILIFAVGMAFRGDRVGLLRQLGSLGGFAFGLLAGAVVAPWAASFLTSGVLRNIILLIVFFGVAIVTATLGQWAGLTVSRHVHERQFGSIDRIFGSLFGIGAALTASWLLAATFSRTAGPILNYEIQTSTVLRALDKTLPPAPDILTRLENSLGAAGLPRVFAGLEPTPPPPVTGPNAAAVNAAADAGRAATVRIESLGCGGILEGSGVVVAPGMVATNAHVVAGIKTPIVQDSRRSYRARVVAFNSSQDIAVLAVPDLPATPLPLATARQNRGTVGAVLGYPGGGNLTISPAAILGFQTALGRNIYGTGLVAREVYELQTVVRPGNSGGPVIAPDGTVIGLVFAMSTTNDEVGYALTSAEVAKAIPARATAPTVSTGQCLRD